MTSLWDRQDRFHTFNEALCDRQNNVTPRDVHVLIPRSYESVRWYGKGCRFEFRLFNQPTLQQKLITRSLKVEEGGRGGVGIRGRCDERSRGRSDEIVSFEDERRGHKAGMWGAPRSWKSQGNGFFLQLTPWYFLKRENECIKSLSHFRLLVIPWTVAHQDPLSMELSRQEYWSG